MRKLCKYVGNPRTCMHLSKCPKNTNSRCEVVKPKEKWVKVKAWAEIDTVMKIRGDYPIIVADNINGARSYRNTPCYILVRKKDLK
jgi:hypothetical protein